MVEELRTASSKIGLEINLKNNSAILKMGRKVTVATACLNQWAMDFEGNYFRILESIKKAKKQGARLLLGPELEVTSYGCGDHFHESDTFLHSWEVLAELLQHPDCTDIMVVLGINWEKLAKDCGSWKTAVREGCRLVEERIFAHARELKQQRKKKTAATLLSPTAAYMPVMHKNVAYNCVVIFLDRKILLIRPKLTVCDDFNYRETRWFSPWMKSRCTEDFYVPRMITAITHQKIVPIGDALISTSDSCIGFEICEELFMPEATHGQQSLDGAEIFCNSSGSHHELHKADYVTSVIAGATRVCGGIYLYSNLRGCDGERVCYNGCSSICVNGDFVACSKQFSLEEVEVVTATVDLEDIRMKRNASRSRGLSASKVEHCPRISVNYSLSSTSEHNYPVSVPIKMEYYSPEEEISYGPACWLWDYLRRCGQGGFFLPLSGGVDSTSTACIVFSMCNLVCHAVRNGDRAVLEDARRIVGDSKYFPTDPKEFCNRVFVTCYMGTENSSSATKARALQLAKQIGSYHMSVGIDIAVSALLSIFTTLTSFVPKFQSQGGSMRENIALQNVQARVRMVISYLFAQLTLWVRGRPGGLLVLGSANVDESLRGYFTKYDCSSADINPIGGISKIDIKKFLKYMMHRYKLTAIDGILSAPSTAELEPLSDSGTLLQTDEDDMGMTYEELSIYGKLRKQKFCGPYSMFCRLLEEWNNKFTPEEIAGKVKSFFRFYAINRHKMTVLTPSYHAESYSPEDNRFDHRQFLYNINWTWQFQAIDDKVKQLNLLDEKLEKSKGTQGQLLNNSTTTQSAINKNEAKNMYESSANSVTSNPFKINNSTKKNNSLNASNYERVSGYLNKTDKVLFTEECENEAECDYKMWEQVRKRYNQTDDSDDIDRVTQFV
ncbi:putative glutamine-dependent NAD(+) synthetase [Nymphon striatum]|nr:putative glutamine-dependent NAD(+) synthetase [Nymphon striatum]